MTTTIVENIQDAYVDQGSPGKNFSSKARIWLRNHASLGRRGYFYPGRPWTDGSKIGPGCKLSLYNAEAWSGSTTLTVQLITSEWGINSVRWSKQPNVLATPTVTLTKSNAAKNTLWEFDITNLLTFVAQGGYEWWGLRIITNRSTKSSMYSTDSGLADFRPTMTVVWYEDPEEPDNLRPSGGNQVSIAQPTLVWDSVDTSGEDDITGLRVRIAPTYADAAAGTSLLYDSGDQTAVATQWNLAGTAFSLADNQQVWWTCRVRDASGTWGDYAEPVTFGRTSKGTPSLTQPTGGKIWEASIRVAWALSGRTQASYAVALTYKDTPTKAIWQSGYVGDTLNDLNIPFLALDASREYRVHVWLRDTIQRVSTPGDPAEYYMTHDVVFDYDTNVAPVSNFSASSDPILPIETLAFQRSAGEPDAFQMQRSEDNGATWRYTGEYDPAEILNGSTYTVKDTTAASYTPYQWRVVAVVGGRQSAGNPTASGEVRRLAPFLMRPDGSDAVTFLNPQRSRARGALEAVHDTMAGPVLVTQYLGKQSGTVRGRLTGDGMGVSAKELKRRLESMRLTPGKQLRLGIADEMFTVVIYNVQIDSVTDTSGITYNAEFQWMEV